MKERQPQGLSDRVKKYSRHALAAPAIGLAIIASSCDTEAEVSPQDPTPTISAEATPRGPAPSLDDLIKNITPTFENGQLPEGLPEVLAICDSAGPDHPSRPNDVQYQSWRIATCYETAAAPEVNKGAGEQIVLFTNGEGGVIDRMVAAGDIEAVEADGYREIVEKYVKEH